MERGLVERYRRWFEYEIDAHAKVRQSLDTVPAERRSGPEFRKAVELLAHLVAARSLWLSRLGAGPVPKQLFLEDPDLAEATTELREVQLHWAEYLRRLTEEELDRVFPYKSWDGPWYRNTVGDVLTQMFGHSWYHRGQIAVLVRAAGGKPAETDFIFWCREPIPTPTSET